MYNNDTKNIAYAKMLLNHTPGVENSRVVPLSESGLPCVPMKEAYKIPYDFLPGGTVYVDGVGECVMPIKLSHSSTIGATGSGKSTLIIFSLVLALLYQGRSNFVVFDNKLELYKMLAGRAKELGYTVKLINTKNSNGLNNTEHYNFFTKSSRRYLERKNKIGEGAEKKTVDGKTVYCYRGKNYTSKDELKKAYLKEKKDIENENKSETSRRITQLLPYESQRDPHWERAGNKFLIGTKMALDEDLLALNERKTNLNQINFYNIKNIFESFGAGRRGALDDRGFFTERGKDSAAFNLVDKDFFSNAEVTMKNHLGFAAEALDKIGTKGFLDLTMANTIDFEEFVSGEKQILFIAYDETNKSDTALINMIITDFIITAQETADRNEKLKLEHPLQIVIDEFGSLPKNQELAESITKSRSRNIYYHLVIQSDAQLREKYEVSAETIINNCNTSYFLGTNDYETIKRVSSSFGEMTDVSMESICSSQNGMIFNKHPAVSCSELKAAVRDGYVYIKSTYDCGLKSQFVPSYKYSDANDYYANFRDYRVEFDEMASYYDTDTIKKADDDDDDDDDDLF